VKKAKSLCYAAAAVVTLVAFIGCASIIAGGDQKVNIASEPTQATVTILDSNGNQVFNSQTPATASLKKGDGFFKGATYKIKIEKSGYKAQEVMLKSDVNVGWYIVGNIFIGGLLGWLIVDPLTGAMWTLSPDKVNAQLGSDGSYLQSDKDSLMIVLLQDLPDSLKLQMQPVQLRN